MADDNLRPAIRAGNDELGRLRWPIVAAVALFGVVWLVFCWPWISAEVTIPWDAKAHFAPQVQFMAASFGRGEWPFWNPYAFSGHPQIADPQSMIFSPPMLLLAVVNHAPSLWAIDLAVLFMLFVAGLGVIWLANDLGWHWVGALIAAVGFAFGAAMAWRLQHFGQVFSLAYFPFVLILLRRALEKKSIVYGIAASIIAAILVLGRDQVALLGIYLLVLYVLWHFAQTGWHLSSIARTLPALFFGGAVGLALVALPILMTVQLAAQSNRPSIDYLGAAAGSLHPALLVTSVIPHLFGSAGEMERFWGPPSFTWEDTGLFIAQNMGVVYLGALPILLIALGLMRGVLFAREVRYFTIAFVVVLAYALGWYLPVFRLAYDFLPGIDLYRRPADAVFLIGGLGAVLAGYVAHRLMSDNAWKPQRWQLAGAIAIPLAAFGLAVAFALQFDRLGQAVPAIVRALGCFGVAAACLLGTLWLKPIRPVLAGLLMIVPFALDVAWNNGPNGASALPMRALAMLETNRPNELIRRLKVLVAAGQSETDRPRVELAGLGFHWPNASLSHTLENTLGYNPVRLQDYSRAVGAGDTVGLPDQRKFTPLFPGYRSQLAKLLGLRYVATNVPVENIDTTLKPGDLDPVARTPQGFIYEIPEAYSRVVFATSARRVSFREIVATGQWPDADLRSTVLLEGDVPVLAPSQPGPARILRYENTEVVVEVRSAAGGWLVLNDIWHPWWEVTVDDEPAEILRANVLFRAVRVGGGRHIVRFAFRPIRGAVSEFFGSQ
ncbi:MAG: hypothetical protein ACR2PA_15930 [Hyphomicrobiaceae bacterium]